MSRKGLENRLQILMKTRVTIEMQQEPKGKTAKLTLEYKSVADASESLRRALPLLLARGRWYGEQLTLDLDFSILSVPQKPHMFTD